MAQWIKARWNDFTHAFTGWLGVTLAALIGVILGVGFFTFFYAGTLSYFGNDPATCNQCHAMNEQYNAWQRGSHRDVAGCNDCHAPHGNLIAKYANKAENGFMHSLKFTLRTIREHPDTRAQPAGDGGRLRVLPQQHRRSDPERSNHRGETLSCIRCRRRGP